MASETRQVPRTNITRQAALVSGDAKNTAMGAGSFLSASTKTLLIAIVLLYNNAMTAIDNAMAVFYNAVIAKNKKQVICEMTCSHFIQVFVLAVNRGVYSVGDLAYYDLTEGGNLPDMNTEAKLLAVAKKLIAGDAARMLVPGAVAMAMPTINDVKDAKIAFEADRTIVNNDSETLKNAQIACNGLNAEADKTIKFMWGEVETKYSDLPRDTMRAKSILWGVIYERIGGTKKMSGKVTESLTGLPIADADIYFENGNNNATSGPDGTYLLDTTLMDVQKLIADHPLYVQFSQEITLVENEDQVVDIVMVKMV